MADLLCTVRGCGERLVREQRTWRCSGGHAFDIARAGHVNLLQPQDRKSLRPGDAPEAVAARRRFLERGFERVLVTTLRDIIAAHAPARRLAVLDIGCGEGHFLRGVSMERDVEAHGVDISPAAVEAATRSQSTATFVVANADRGLPHADGAFDIVMSINARLPVGEMRRVLRDDGFAIIVVPAPDDLLELRQAVLGEGWQHSRLERVRGEMGEAFDEMGERRVSDRVRMEVADLRDALLMTYRGARHSQQERVESLTAMDITVAHDVTWWCPVIETAA